MRKDIVEKLETLITAAFGLVAALAWNEAIQSLFREGGPLFFLAAGGKWVYAIVVTILAVLLTMWIGRVASRAKGTPKEEAAKLAEAQQIVKESKAKKKK